MPQPKKKKRVKKKMWGIWNDVEADGKFALWCNVMGTPELFPSERLAKQMIEDPEREKVIPVIISYEVEK